MNTPTLCLFMDGEKIVSHEIISNLDRIQSWKEFQQTLGTSYYLLTIPLSLCALAPDMIEGLKEIEKETDGRNLSTIGQYRAHAKVMTLLSRIPQP